jgi:hypothetical protein
VAAVRVGRFGMGKNSLMFVFVCATLVAFVVEVNQFSICPLLVSRVEKKILLQSTAETF